MPSSSFPLRWESTGDQWWYASPVDWAAANGHYDLVRELLRLDSNHLIKLTSLRRIRRLETVWDDESHCDDVAKRRSEVARKLFLESETRTEKNPLLKAGYGGWLLYTAASAGDLPFVQSLLERDPLLVFGEGEYGITDILYAAARSHSSEVFRLVFDFAASPRLSKGTGEEVEEVPSVFKQEMVNRAVHAAARGGNLTILKELLGDCSDVLMYRDVLGSTILHAAAGRGQLEVVRNLIASYDVINSVDNRGNTSLHIAAFRGQLAVVEALIHASPSSISATNDAGETFLHMAISGFLTPGFRRLDRQVEFMKQLVCGTLPNAEEIINLQNREGRTALHMAIVGNISVDLVELLMKVHSIDVNIRDTGEMTALDILRQRPWSTSSDMLINQLMSAGGIFGCDHSMTRAIVSHLRRQSMESSPGTSFGVSDTEIFLCTGIGNDHESTRRNVQEKPVAAKTLDSINHAAWRLKGLLGWARAREREPKNGGSVEIPAPLRQKFLKPSSALSSNKRAPSARSQQASPVAKKKFASGLVNGVVQAMSPRRSCSSSLKIEKDSVRPCPNKTLMNHYLCFGAPDQSVKDTLGSRQQGNAAHMPTIVSVA